MDRLSVAAAVNFFPCRSWAGESVRRFHRFLQQNGFVAAYAENGQPRPPTFPADSAEVVGGLVLIYAIDLTNEFIPRRVELAALLVARVPKRDQGEIRIGYQVHCQRA